MHLANVAKRTRCNATAVTALAAAPLAASATEEEPLPTAGHALTGHGDTLLVPRQKREQIYKKKVDEKVSKIGKASGSLYKIRFARYKATQGGHELDNIYRENKRGVLILSAAATFGSPFPSCAPASSC